MDFVTTLLTQGRFDGAVGYLAGVILVASALKILRLDFSLLPCARYQIY